MSKYYLAIDLGASSGRHIVGWDEGGKIITKEVYRFPNQADTKDGHLTWDVFRLMDEIKRGIDLAKESVGAIESLSIDTWGVDYVLLKGDEEILPCYAYRDKRTQGVIDMVHEKIPFSTLYQHTGIQFEPFNTIYQLYDDKIHGRLDEATDLLLLPEYLLWKLCGTKATEFTHSTTTGLINAATSEFDMDIIDTLGLNRRLFSKPQMPGTYIGDYEGIKCVLCASHDTASAVEGIPMEGNQPYISSGTWSLLGVKTPHPITDEASEKANYSNEGGVGYNRYQKNIMGMWLINRLQGELCPDTPFPEIVKLAENSTSEVIVDANDEAFLSPESMVQAFDSKAKGALKTPGDYFRCAYLSLALSYKEAVKELEDNTGRTYDELYIVGGGAKNEFLNRLTQEATKKKVIALAIEATALGNLKVQMLADKGGK